MIDKNIKDNSYTNENPEVIQIEANKILDKIVNFMDRDVSDKKVQELIHEKRMHICKYYYNCTLEIYKQLGKTYLEDSIVARSYEKKKKGLAKFISDAIVYYTDNYKD